MLYAILDGIIRKLSKERAGTRHEHAFVFLFEVFLEKVQILDT